MDHRASSMWYEACRRNFATRCAAGCHFLSRAPQSMTYTRHRRRRRDIQSILSYSMMILICCVPFVCGQSMEVSVTYAAPDLSTPQSIVSLVLLLALTPLYFASFVQIMRHRDHYPIAGRGATFLSIQAAAFTCGHLALCLVQLFFPKGVPCGFQYFLIFAVTLPHAFVYMVRGYILVFRKEIQTFLEELHYKEKQLDKQKQQCAAMQQHNSSQPQTPTAVLVVKHRFMPVQPQDKARDRALNQRTQSNPGISRQSSSPTSNSPRCASAPLHDEIQLEDIPGYWFVSHRAYAERSFLLMVVILFMVILAIPIGIMAALDPDVTLTNDFFHKHQLIPDTVDYDQSQFAPDTFFNSPACLLISPKIFLFKLLIGLLIVPEIIWFAWRIHKNKQREKERERLIQLEDAPEQKDSRETPVRIVMAPADPHAQQTGKPLPTAGVSPSGDSNIRSLPETPTSPSQAVIQLMNLPKLSPGALQKRASDITVSATTCRRGQLSDSELVVREFLYVIILALITIPMYSLVDWGANSWIEMSELVVYLPVWALSIAHPLYILRDTSERHRMFLMRNRESIIAVQQARGISHHPSVSNMLVNKPSQTRLSKKTSEAEPVQLHHHLPFFQLGFILSNPLTYPIFLAFLQREYASENALFYKEVDSFQARVRALEQRIPSWKRLVEADEEPEQDEETRVERSRKRVEIRIGNPVGKPALKSGIPHTRPQVAAALSRVAQLTLEEPHEAQGHFIDINADADQSHDISSLLADAGLTVAEEAPAVRQPSVDDRFKQVKTPSRTHSSNGKSKRHSGFPMLSPTDSVTSAFPFPPDLRQSTGDIQQMDILHQMTLRNEMPVDQAWSESTVQVTKAVVSAVEARVAEHSRSRVGTPNHGAVGSKLTSQPSSRNGTLPPVNEGSRHFFPAPSPSPSPVAVLIHPVNEHTQPVQQLQQQEVSSTRSTSGGSEYSTYSPDDLLEMHEEAARVKYWCTRLYANYVKKHSIYEVKLPDDVSALVQSQVNQIQAYQPTPMDGDEIDRHAMRNAFPLPPPLPLSTIYKQAAVIVFELIQRDSFRRFILTEEFHELLLRADNAELARAEKQPDLQQETNAIIAKAVHTINTKKVEQNLRKKRHIAAIQQELLQEQKEREARERQQQAQQLRQQTELAIAVPLQPTLPHPQKRVVGLAPLTIPDQSLPHYRPETVMSNLELNPQSELPLELSPTIFPIGTGAQSPPPALE